MINSFLLELLVDPLTREKLVFDGNQNLLTSTSSGKTYPVIDTVPRILPDAVTGISVSDLHLKFDTKFAYADHYQKDAEIFSYTEESTSQIEKDESRRLHESILNEISEDMAIVLDVGCGGGWASKKLIPHGKMVISMDISSDNPVHAVQDMRHDRHAGLIADAYYIPIKENSVDCIIASEILEHVSDPAKFISSLLRVLKHNGKLIITTPYNEKIDYYLCVHCNKPTPKSAHLHSFNEVNIKKYLPGEGITWSATRQTNKYLIKARSHIVLGYFSYRYWKKIDSLFNRLLNCALRLQIVIIKL